MVTGETLTHCRLRSLPTSAFRDLVRTDVAFSYAVHEKHGEEICNSLGRGGLSLLDAEHRLLRVLKEYCTSEAAAAAQNGPRFIVRLRRYELAQVAFMSAEHLSRLLKALEAAGVLRREHGWIVIPDPHKLTTM